jgi:hypothetical protein
MPLTVRQYLTTINSMEQCPSREANRSTSTEEILRILWNTTVYNRLYTSPPPVSILSQIHPIHAPPPPAHFTKIRFNIVFSSTPGSSKVPASFTLLHPNLLCTFPLPHTSYMSCPSQSSWFDHPNNIWWGVQSINSSLCSLHHSCYLIRLGPIYPRQHPILANGCHTVSVIKLTQIFVL